MLLKALQRLRWGIVLCVLFLLNGTASPAGSLKVTFSDFTNSQAGSVWQKWAQREEIQPRCYIDARTFRSAPNSLAISGNSNAAAYGGWSTVIEGIRPGQYYLMTAYYRAQWVPHQQFQVVARLDWLNNKGNRIEQPD